MVVPLWDLLGPVWMEPGHRGHVAGVHHGHDPVLYTQLAGGEDNNAHVYTQIQVNKPEPKHQGGHVVSKRRRSRKINGRIRILSLCNELQRNRGKDGLEKGQNPRKGLIRESNLH